MKIIIFIFHPLFFTLHTLSLILSMFTPFSVAGCSLALLKPGEQGIIAFYQTQNHKILTQIDSLGIKIGNSITLEKYLPSLIIKLEDRNICINKEIAQTIYVRIVEV